MIGLITTYNSMIKFILQYAGQYLFRDKSGKVPCFITNAVLCSLFFVFYHQYWIITCFSQQTNYNVILEIFSLRTSQLLKKNCPWKRWFPRKTRYHTFAKGSTWHAKLIEDYIFQFFCFKFMLLHKMGSHITFTLQTVYRTTANK